MRIRQPLGLREVVLPAAFAAGAGHVARVLSAAHGDVKRAVRLLADPLRAGQNGQQIVTEMHGFEVGAESLRRHNSLSPA